MKKALIIFAVVAGYSLFDAALLLSMLHPNFLIDSPSTHQTLLLLAQLLLLIPGLAALVSRLLYGPRGWKRRALKILLTVPIGILALALVLASLALIGWVVTADFGFGTPSWVISTIATVLCSGLMAVLVWVGWIAFRRTGNKSVELESARWLNERRSGLTARDWKWRNRGIRWAVCIPAALVLLIFLFFPESERILLTLRRGYNVQVGDYNVRLPGSWFILVMWKYEENGWSGISGLTGVEMQHQLGWYIRGQLELSEWSIEVRPANNTRPWDAETPVARRIIPIVDGSLACLEYSRPYYRHPVAVMVECSGPRGLHAHLIGEQHQIPEFYRTLGQITVRGK